MIPGLKNLNFFNFLITVVSEFFSRREIKHLTYLVVYRQIFFTGFEALSIITLAAVAFGAVIIIQGNSVLSNFSQSPMYYTILVTIIPRELGALLTALIVVARSGTAISTELGNMNINNETLAIYSFGISPIAYLAVPRVLGVAISVVCLSIYFNVAAFLGSWFISFLFTSVVPTEFLFDLLSALSLNDLLMGFVKSCLFGFFCGIIACYNGFKVQNSITEVPQRTIKTVVNSVSSIIFLDIIVTALFYIFAYD
jgi:phospholipid/cholesterol/gamma-HCH transport system permease protein